MSSALDVVLTGPIKPIHLGKYDPTRSGRERPIIITLESSDQVNRAIPNHKHLKSSTNFKLVNISKERTPEQIALHCWVRKELLARQTAGKSDIYIKHLRDIPKIVKSSSACHGKAVFFTETWVADNVDNRGFQDPTFVVYRSDRFALAGRCIGGDTSVFMEKLSVAPVDASRLDSIPSFLADCVQCGSNKVFFLDMLENAEVNVVPQRKHNYRPL
ncbi:hypothetical protein Trydic_g4008 [Trypoxylus dichotomus]